MLFVFRVSPLRSLNCTGTDKTEENNTSLLTLQKRISDGVFTNQMNMATGTLMSYRILWLFFVSHLVTGLDQPLLLVSVPKSGQFPLDRGIYKISESDDSVAERIALPQTIAQKDGLAYDPLECRVYYKDARSTYIEPQDYDDQYSQFAFDFNVSPEKASVSLVKASLDGQIRETFYDGNDIKTGDYNLAIDAVSRKLFYGVDAAYNHGILEFDLRTGNSRRLFPTRSVQQMYADSRTGYLWWCTPFEILKASYSNPPNYRTVRSEDPGYPVAAFAGHGTLANKAFYIQNVPVDVGWIIYSTDIDANTGFQKHILISPEDKKKKYYEYSAATALDGFLYIYYPDTNDIDKLALTSTLTTDPPILDDYDVASGDNVRQIAVVEGAVGVAPGSTFLLVGYSNQNRFDKLSLALDSAIPINPSLTINLDNAFTYDPVLQVIYYVVDSAEHSADIASIDLDGNNNAATGFKVINVNAGLLLDNEGRRLYVVYWDTDYRIQEFNLVSGSSRELFTSIELTFFGSAFDQFRKRIIMAENDGLVFLPVDEFHKLDLNVVAKAVTPHITDSDQSFEIKGFAVDNEDDRVYFGAYFFVSDKFELRSVSMSDFYSGSVTWTSMDFLTNKFQLISQDVFNNKIYGFSNADGLVAFDTSDLSQGATSIKTDLFEMVGSDPNNNDVDDIALITELTTFTMESGDSLRVEENDVSFTFNVLRNGFKGDVGRVDLVVVPTSSSNEDALFPKQQTLTFTAEETSKEVTIGIHDDHVVEADALFELRLENPINGFVEGMEYQNLMLADDDYTISFESTKYEVLESANELFVKLQREGNPRERLLIGVNATSIEAVAGEDFPNGNPIATANFPAGGSQATVRIPIVDDNIFEPLETFKITMDISSQMEVNENQMAVICVQDNEATFSFSQSHYSVREDEYKLDSTVVRNGYAGETATVVVKTVGADEGDLSVSARAGVDFIAIQREVNFGIGETRKNISILIVDDVYEEPAEAFKLTLSDSQLSLVDPSSAFVAIVDNIDEVEPASFYSLERSSYDLYENEKEIQLSVLRSGDLVQPGRIRLGPKVGGGSVSNLDIEDPYMDIDFQENEDRRTVTMRIIDDTVVEDDETFFWQLSQPIAGDVTTPYQTTITIRNDDSEFLFASNNYEVTEGTDVVLEVVVARRGDVRGPGSVLLTSVAQTATENEDYYQEQTTLSFAPYELIASANIFITDDNLVEDDEDFRVLLSPIQGGLQGDPSGITVTIKDNDSGLDGQVQGESSTDTDGQGIPTMVIIGGSIGGGIVVSIGIILVGVFVMYVIKTTSSSAASAGFTATYVPALNGGGLQGGSYGRPTVNGGGFYGRY